MCTAILSIEPGHPLLLAGIRDELADRAWLPPDRHWPDFPGLIGGLDLQAGGTWLAVAPESHRVACVLNARGRAADPATRRSRGVLPLRAAAGLELDRAELAATDPFHLVVAEPETARLFSWDGDHLTERELGLGLHIIVNSGLDGEFANSGGPRSDTDTEQPDTERPDTERPDTERPDTERPDTDPPDPELLEAQQREAQGLAMERARIAHFGPLFRGARRPSPHPGVPARQAWGEWLPLLDGDGLPADDPRALIPRRDLGGGRVWGTTSISAVAMSQDELRYDFNATPGDPAAWYLVATPAAV